MSELRFDEAKHEYTIGGRKIAGVTEVLQPLINYDRVPRDVLERACLLGQAVHKATELHDQDDLDIDSLSPEIVPYLEAWQRFCVECDFKPVTIEQRVYHPTYGYAGTLDRSGIIRGEMAILDIKKMMTLGPVIGVQTAAYREAYNHPLPREQWATRRYGLGLRPDGTYRLEAFNDPSDFAMFLSLLTIKNWKAKHGI